MELSNFLNDDDAVSPVIGVILMVAITVILAAVIATFVLGLGEQVSSTAPQASFSADFDESASGSDSFGTTGSYDGILTLTHSGGATLNPSSVNITGAAPNSTISWSVGTTESELTAGSSIEIWANNDDVVRVVWASDEGDNSATLRVWEGPNA